MNGFVCVDKPSGPTSRDVVDAVQRATGIRKAGHAGTLDPMATGAVVVAIGSATRLIRFIQEFDKEYLATARFGVATDTLDADGVVVESSPLPITLEGVVEASRSFEGEILQVPPMVSALKVGGQRLYKLARQGVEVERKPRPVTVKEFEVLSVGEGDYPEVRLRIVCGKGTYVRSLADDLAISLGGRAHLIALRRIRIGSLAVDAVGVPMDGLTLDIEPITPNRALEDLPSLEVDQETARKVGNGAKLDMEGADGLVRILNQAGGLLAVYRRSGSGASAEVVLS